MTPIHTIWIHINGILNGIFDPLVYNKNSRARVKVEQLASLELFFFYRPTPSLVTGSRRKPCICMCSSNCHRHSNDGYLHILPQHAIDRSMHRFTFLRSHGMPSATLTC